ncbi:MAG TPA: YceI family protein [Lutibacter sp.]|nr:YceI family protein [Lutibacter sp.]
MQYKLLNFSTLLFGLLFIITSVSCDQLSKTKKTTNQFDKSGKKYSIVPETTSVFWTGYKTSSKTPVKGQFMKLNITNPKQANTAKEAIDGIEFSIPVSSLFSNEKSRDTKLKDFFFKVMDQTEFLSGNLNVENDTLINVSLKMNGITKTIPMSYFLNGQMLSMQGKIDLATWNAQNALTSLHQVCKDKHTGEDGVSKTWSEVGLSVESYLKVE